MNFYSAGFALFFLFVFCVYWALRRALPFARVPSQLALLLASYAFYASWNPSFCLILLVFSLVIAGFGVGMRRLPRDRRGLLLGISIMLALLNLGWFKYYEFLRTQLEALLLAAAPLLSAQGAVVHLPAIEVIMPLGISFYTFQGITYLVAVYRDELQERYSLLEVMLFIAFFPTLLAGPICRAADLLPRLRSHGSLRIANLEFAVWLVLCGLFKKLVVASYLAAQVVDPVFANAGLDGIGPVGAPATLLALYGYAVQIYCDFSGYSDMALALALMLGIPIKRNFDAPYTATDLADFWRRWHISLSSWIRDYLYIPLGGSRGTLVRTCFNLAVAMLASGLWHGANWTFLVWGGLHAAGSVALRLLRGLGLKAPAQGTAAAGWRTPLGWLLTFHFVVFAWVFFRAPSVANALDVLAGLGMGWEAWSANQLAQATVIIGFLLMHWLNNWCPRLVLSTLRGTPWLLQPLLIAPVFALIIALGPDGVPPFIYFAF